MSTLRRLRAAHRAQLDLENVAEGAHAVGALSRMAERGVSRDARRRYGRVPLELPAAWALGLVSAAMVADHGPVAWLVSGLASLAFVFAPVVRSAVGLPLGLVRLSWACARFAGTSRPHRHRCAGAALEGARALLRRPTEAGARFVEQRLAACFELATGGATAMAFIALARGDREQARAILGVVDEIPTDEADPVATSMAREFLALDAASRGDWRRAVALGGRPGSSAVTRLLALAGRRLLGRTRAPSAGRLWIAWALAPRRRYTCAVVLHALRAIPRAPGPADGSLDAVLLLANRAACELRREDIVAAILCVDWIRSSESILADLSRRALIYRSVHSVGARDALARAVESHVVHAIVDGQLPAAWIPEGPTGDSARASVRDHRTARAQALVAELARRASDCVDFDEADEWRAWGDAREASVVVSREADDAAQREFFWAVYAPLTSYGVRLSNVRSCRVLAGDVFRVLHNLAYAAGASDAYELVDRNVIANRADRLPRIDLVGAGVPLCHLARVTRLRSMTIRALPNRIFFVLAGLSATGALRSCNLSTLTVSTVILLFSTVVLLLIARIYLLRRLAEVVQMEDGLVLQSRLGRHVARPGEVLSVSPGPGPILRIRLRRHPHWLPRTLFTVASTGAAARAFAARIREQLSVAMTRYR